MTTTRTTFSKPKDSDYKELYDLKTNDQVRKYLGGAKPEDEFKKNFKEILSAKKPEAYWIVREKATELFIGLLSITDHHDKEYYEVSYELHPNIWGKGYGTEVTQRAIQYAFEELNLDKIIAETQKKNKASIRVLEKVGMKFEKEIERFHEIQVIYGIQKTIA